MKEFHIEMEERYPHLNPSALIEDQYGHRYDRVCGSTPEEARQRAAEALQEIEWAEGHSVGLRTSNELVEARTVLSRAETALSWIDAKINHRAECGQLVDPEVIDIARDLASVIHILRKWERTGRLPKYKPTKKEEK